MLEQQKLDIGLIAEPKNRRSLSFLPVMRIEDTFVCTRSYLENLPGSAKVTMSIRSNPGQSCCSTAAI